MKRPRRWVNVTVYLEGKPEWRRGPRWHAFFMIWPHGYFHGAGKTPAQAFGLAWRKMRRRVPLPVRAVYR